MRTFAGKRSVLLERPNSTGRLPVDDATLAQRGWELVSLARLQRLVATGSRIILATPNWTRGDRSAAPVRMRLRTQWLESDLQTWFNQSSKSRGLVWAKRVAHSEEVLAEASYFYLHAATCSGAFHPEMWV